MSKLKSIFGAYADQLQLVIDARNDRFDPLWYPKYFGLAPKQMSLDFTTVIGATRIEAAASVVDRDSETPLRSRPDLSKYSGSIPAIREMFMMKESDLREYEIMKAMPLSDAARQNAILDLIWNDTKKAGNSVFKRVDMMCLQAVSTGVISLDTTNNPDGIVTGTIDLLMPSDNKKQAAVTWATAATATPITDITNVVKAGQDIGVTFAKILMSPILFGYFKKTKEVIDSLTGFYYGPKPGGSFNPIGVTTLDNINNFLSQTGLPTIELVDQSYGVEKDGKIGVLRPFSDNNASFIPAGQLGVIKNAFAIEEFKKSESVSYANFGPALISKWVQNEPVREWTKAEWNAFPGFESIDRTFLLTAVY
ncbi:major capsid protein [Flavihumibacter petaseus]|uniref:Putative phage major head protein n=1 Tax=Flavihumibacter petaseus NBRC 106054 TaxID=1220578 RepID=A0A0E9N296_9BACT|nr:major capsid protein [Flavihumibacter petaseus]GAO43791.1 putative phage major head protein [Flavihumibacter petaseus NBRC 106054]